MLDDLLALGVVTISGLAPTRVVVTHYDSGNVLCDVKKLTIDGALSLALIVAQKTLDDMRQEWREEHPSLTTHKRN